MAGGAIDAVKERTDIVDLVGKAVQLRQTGRYFKGRCPFHEEKTPSFVVYPDSQSYHCFGCGKTGDIFTWVMENEHLEFRDALVALAERAGVQLEERNTRQRDDEQTEQRNSLIELNERAAAWFSNMLWTSPAGEHARAELHRRGVDRPTAERFGLGYAPDAFEALKKHFTGRGSTEAELVTVGLLTVRDDDQRSYDRFRNRIMFPIRNHRGEIVGFGGRAMGDGKPKYLNTAETPIFNKRSLLYGLDLALPSIRRLRSIVIVEGYMDAIAAHQFGHDNVVASMGTALTPDQVKTVRRSVDRVFLALDSDAAGQMATMRGIEQMRTSLSDEKRADVGPSGMVRFETTLGAEVRIVLLPHGKDPDDTIRADPAAWPRIVDAAVPLAEFVLTTSLRDIEPTPAARAKALNEIAIPILRELSDPIVLSQYVGLTSNLLSIRDTDIHSAVMRSRSAPRGAPPPAQRIPERPRALNHERFLAALVALHPAEAQELVLELDNADILDTRHRLLLDMVRFGMANSEELLAHLEPEMQEYVNELLESATPAGTDRTVGRTRELQPAIERLLRQRHDERYRQAQADVREAQQAGDSEALAQAMQRIMALAQQQGSFAPIVSPYFRDSRSESI